MKQGLARLAGAIAIAVSAFLLVAVMLGPGANILNLWTIVVCAVGGIAAWYVRPGWAALMLVVGAAPAMFAGVGFLYLPSLLIAMVAAVARSGESSSVRGVV
jgi:hypothetical protein